MKKFKLYEEFSSKVLDTSEVRAIELVILFTLKQLFPDGGNNSYGEEIDWEKLDPIFPSIAPKGHPFQGGGPDLYISFDADDAKAFTKELNILYDIADDAAYKGAADKLNKATEIFKEYGLQLETLAPDENIINLDLPDSAAGAWSGKLSQKDLKFIVDFYKSREKKIKELEQKHKTVLTSKKFGL